MIARTAGDALTLDPADLRLAAALAPLTLLLLVAPPGLLLLRRAGAQPLGLSGAVALGLGLAAGASFLFGLLRLPLGALAAALAVASLLSLVGLAGGGGFPL